VKNKLLTKEELLRYLRLAKISEKQKNKQFDTRYGFFKTEWSGTEKTTTWQWNNQGVPFYEKLEHRMFNSDVLFGATPWPPNAKILERTEFGKPSICRRTAEAIWAALKYCCGCCCRLCSKGEETTKAGTLEAKDLLVLGDALAATAPHLKVTAKDVTADVTPEEITFLTEHLEKNWNEDAAGKLEGRNKDKLVKFFRFANPKIYIAEDQMRKLTQGAKERSTLAGLTETGGWCGSCCGEATGEASGDQDTPDNEAASQELFADQEELNEVEWVLCKYSTRSLTKMLQGAAKAGK
jgi:hypothetical protein